MKYGWHKSLFGLFMVFILAASMLFFGIDIGSQSSQYALKIGDNKISYSAFADYKRQIENRLRSQLGGSYNSLVEQGVINIDKQAIDTMIPEKLIESLSQNLKYEVSNQKLIELIQRQFPGEQYANFLRNTGQRASTFEERTRKSMQTDSVQEFINDFSLAPVAMAKASFLQEEKTYDLKIAEFKSESFLTKVVEPTKEELQIYYEENSGQFETEPQISYSYISFEPKDFENTIEVSQDDLEWYYTENTGKFIVPEQISASHIQINIPESADEATKSGRNSPGFPSL